jgi:hypothetical protein
MDKTAANLHVCHRCPQFDRSDLRRSACQRDGMGIVQHAAADDCPRFHEQPVKVKLPLARAVVHGAVGIAKAIAGRGGASEELVAQRAAICGTCDKAIITGGVVRRCALCGCSTWAKIRNAAEQCPAGKW